MKAEDLQVKVAQKVRGDSKYLQDLTSTQSLQPVVSSISGDLETTFAEIALNSNAYSDIRSIKGPTGQIYYFSVQHMTEGYARILARVKAGDPCITIAETVREESRVYPRTTNIELFKYGLFKIDREKLDEYVATTLERYDDIKKIVTPKGAVCLYSSQYLTPDWAAYLAKKAETPDG